MRISNSFHGHSQSEPLGIEYIAAKLARAGFAQAFGSSTELDVWQSGGACRLAMFTGITSEYPIVRRVAEIAKARGDITVIGGYHVCGTNKNADEGPFDYVVRGEGEEAALGLANALLRNNRGDLQRFETTKVGSTFVVMSPRITDLDALPFPLRDEGRLAHYYIQDMMWPPPSQQHNTALLLASRGCAYQCDFCASSTVWGRGSATARRKTSWLS